MLLGCLATKKQQLDISRTDSMLKGVFWSLIYERECCFIRKETEVKTALHLEERDQRPRTAAHESVELIFVFGGKQG